ncbi:precorrin-6x reductase [Methanocaldococcus infernus ME]|uniref:Precorrin-6x reductase n=1 Tax=Methanocaldococcus infernus (strain DSM 11812 / JCM 15783 / ME) TaxID=573063 RepID=D5VUB7_METIM|nr:precorrin-6A reductase [Methanocaldococcus infernus]ADG12729.1 precorrin-6x reductase [Methanocaldococcus infernus ME]
MNILLMGGTAESKTLGEELRKNLKNLFLIYTSTTNYGGELAKHFANIIIKKPLNLEELRAILKDYKIDILIDATHPFAINASKNAILACKEENVDYIRFERKSERITHEKVKYFKDFDSLLKEAKGYKRVFYMAGIKNLKRVVDHLGEEKVVARVLPISVPEALNILPQKNIVAMYGTFSKELNKYLILDYGCEAIITKESGDTGGFKDKVLGALEAGADVLVLEKPKLEYPIYFNDVDKLIEYIRAKYENNKT